MTISTTNAKKVFLANGATTMFGWDFYVPDLASLVVQSLSPAGVLTTVVSGFTVSGLNTSSGAVTFLSAPASGYQIILSRVIGYSQTVDLTNQDGFYPEVIEGALDRLTMLTQQLKEQVDRSIKGNIADTITLVLPSQTLRANKVMAFDATGQAIVADISNQAAAAATSASQALTYANTAGAAQTAAQAARDSALAAFANFQNVFLGASATPPTTDIDGSALEAGDLYYKTGAAAGMYVWTGSAWSAAYVSGGSFAATANNLSDLASAATARANLGISTVGATGAYSDLTGKPTLGTAAALAVGTGIGNVIQLDGSSKIPAVDGSQLTGLVAGQISGLSGGATLGTAQATTSGSAKDYTGLSGLKRIQMIFDQVSTGLGTFIRLGTAGGFLTSGYTGSSILTNGSGNSILTYSSGFYIELDPATGIVTLDHIGGNVWVVSGVLGSTSGGAIDAVAGRISLGGALTQLRFLGGSNFTAGSVNIITE